jgi:hypothetical protein
MTTLTCENCGTSFEKTNKRGPKPKFCSDACRQAGHRAKKPEDPPPSPTPSGAKPVITLRDVVNIAELDLTTKQCDVIINAFTKARLRAAKRERDAT